MSLIPVDTYGKILQKRTGNQNSVGTYVRIFQTFDLKFQGHQKVLWTT